MGWAKYFEDNLSINNDRLLMACENQALFCVSQATNVYKVNREKDQEAETSVTSKDRRCGLELCFQIVPDKKTITKLRLNGWWWSNARSCWCNTNTFANRKYVWTALGKGDFLLTAAR